MPVTTGVNPDDVPFVYDIDAAEGFALIVQDGELRRVALESLTGGAGTGEGTHIPPTITLANTVTSIETGTSTASRVKMADIIKTTYSYDADLATLTVSGTDSASFEIFDGDLYLQAGVVLDDSVKSTYSINVDVLDATLTLISGGPVWDRVAFTLTVTAQYESQSETLFAAMSVQPDNDRKDAIDTFIAALINAGIWNKLDVLWVMKAHDAQAARLNWKSPGTYDATVNGANLVFTADEGYRSEAVGSYLTPTGYDLSGSHSLTQNSASLMFQCSTIPSAGTFCSSTSDSADMRALPSSGGFIECWLCGGASVAVASVSPGNKLVTVVRENSSTLRLYKDSTLVASNTASTSNAITGVTPFLGTASASFTGSHLHVLAMGEQLSAAEIAAFKTAWDAYQAAIPVDAATQAIINAMTAPPSANRRTHIDAFVRRMKTGLVWTKMDVLHLYAAHNAQAAHINWKSPGTYDGVVSGTPTHTADRGYAKGASTGGLTIAYNPSTAPGASWLTASAHLGCYSLTSGAQTASEYEVQGVAGPTFNRMENLTGGFAQPRINAKSATTNAAGVGGDGHCVVDIINTTTTGLQYWRNNTLVLSGDAAGPTRMNDTFKVLGNNNTREISAVHMGGGLTSSDVSILYRALSDYLHHTGAI